MSKPPNTRRRRGQSGYRPSYTNPKKTATSKGGGWLTEAVEQTEEARQAEAQQVQAAAQRQEQVQAEEILQDVKAGEKETLHPFDRKIFSPKTMQMSGRAAEVNLTKFLETLAQSPKMQGDYAKWHQKKTKSKDYQRLSALIEFVIASTYGGQLDGSPWEGNAKSATKAVLEVLFGPVDGDRGPRLSSFQLIQENLLGVPPAEGQPIVEESELFTEVEFSPEQEATISELKQRKAAGEKLSRRQKAALKAAKKAQKFTRTQEGGKLKAEWSRAESAAQEKRWLRQVDTRTSKFDRALFEPFKEFLEMQRRTLPVPPIQSYVDSVQGEKKGWTANNFAQGSIILVSRLNGNTQVIVPSYSRTDVLTKKTRGQDVPYIKGLPTWMPIAEFKSRPDLQPEAEMYEGDVTSLGQAYRFSIAWRTKRGAPDKYLLYPVHGFKEVAGDRKDTRRGQEGIRLDYKGTATPPVTQGRSRIWTQRTPEETIQLDEAWEKIEEGSLGGVDPRGSFSGERDLGSFGFGENIEQNPRRRKLSNGRKRVTSTRYPYRRRR